MDDVIFKKGDNVSVAMGGDRKDAVVITDTVGDKTIVEIEYIDVLEKKKSTLIMRLKNNLINKK